MYLLLSNLLQEFIFLELRDNIRLEIRVQNSCCHVKHSGEVGLTLGFRVLGHLVVSPNIL
jgi:hypothetical protein